MEGLVTTLSDICEDFEDDSICDKIGEITDILNDIVEGNTSASFPGLVESMDEYAEMNSEDEDREEE